MQSNSNRIAIECNRIAIECNRIAIECNRIAIECNRKAIEHLSNQSQKSLENSIDSINRKTIERLHSIKFD